MGVEALTQSVCDLALGFGEGHKEGEKKMSRPFGVSLLMAGYDRREGPLLFFSDPSGSYMYCRYIIVDLYIVCIYKRMFEQHLEISLHIVTISFSSI